MVMAMGLVVTSLAPIGAPMVVATEATDRIALGVAHTCAIDQDDLIWCWGSNTFGQLGSATHAGLTRSLVPVRADDLPGGRRPVRIVAGATHSCVLADDASVWCWGGNDFGQSGGSGVTLLRSPAQMSFAHAVRSVVAGGSHTCAVLTNDETHCWGLNNFGQLGVGSSDTNVNDQPRQVAQVPGSFTVRDLSIGSTHMCAVSAADEAWCWGSWVDGKLGTSGTSNVPQPQRSAALQGAAHLAATGADHTCIALATSVTCFGNNSFGQLAFTPNNTPNDVPTERSLGAAVLDLEAGENFTCALVSSSTPVCWGANASQQLGPGSALTADNHIPTAVAGLDATVVDIALGGEHACAVMGDGMVRCWGENNDGQLGLNSRTDRHTATQVSLLNVIPTTTTTTTTTSTTTSTSTTTTAVPVTNPPVSGAQPGSSSDPNATPGGASAPTSSVVTTTTVPKRVTMRLRRVRKVSAATLARAVALTIPKTSQGKMRISIVRGSRNCRFSGTSVQAVRRGSCTVSVELIPRRGKSIRRTVAITVFG